MSDLEKSAENYAKSEENIEYANVTPQDTHQRNSLGKAKTFTEDPNRPLMADIGYKNIPLENLPSQGKFYPHGTQIVIRSATVSEIRHWSTIDETDLLMVDDMINYVIERCVRVQIPNTSASWRDIKDVDRFYIIFAIAELTFKDGENKIYVNTGEGERIEIKKEMLSYFNLDEKLMKYYNPNNCNLELKLKNGETIECYLPSIGISQFLKNYVRGKQQQGLNFDQSFVKYASFLFDDWRTLNQLTYEKEVQNSSTWSLQKISTLSRITDILTDSVRPEVHYMTPSGVEQTTPLNIEGGIKSIFIISDIFDQLV